MAELALPTFTVAWQSATSAIHRDASGSFFIMEWLDYNTSIQFRQASETLLDIIKKAPGEPKALLNDTEKLKIIGLTDQAWVREDYLPRLIAAGVKRIAMVNSVHYFTRVGVQEIMRSRSEEATEYFATRDEALRWLCAK